MEKNECIEAMIKLKAKREQQIKESLKDNEPLQTIINDIKYLGQIKYTEQGLDGKDIEQVKEIYMIVEENDGKMWYKYYDENLELIAAEDGIEEQIAFAENSKEKDMEFLDKIQELDKMEGISLSELEQEYLSLEYIAIELGIDLDEIEEYKKLDLNQEIDEKEENEENEVISKEETNKLDIREKTNLNQNIEGRTLGNKLGVNNITLPDGSKLTDGKYLAIISTSSLNEHTKNSSNQKYSFAVIRENGEAVPLGNDILTSDERSGINPINSDLTINSDGRVNEESNVSSFRIVNGNRNEYLKISNDEVSGHEIKYSKYSSEDGKYVSTELRTDRDIYVNDDVRQYLRDASEGTQKAQDTIDRSEIHDEYDEQQDITLVDNDLNNDSHTHISSDDYVPNADITWGEYANQLGYRGDGSIELAVEKYKETLEKNQNLDSKQIVELTIDEANEEFRNPQELDH